jgi:hypothetical protein
MCPISQVKVVILGQDPYHNPQQAQGTVARRSVQVSLPLHRAHLIITDASVFILQFKIEYMLHCIVKLKPHYNRAHPTFVITYLPKCKMTNLRENRPTLK